MLVWLLLVSSIVTWVLVEFLGKASVVDVLVLLMYVDFGFQVEFLTMVEADPIFLLLFGIELHLQLEAISKFEVETEWLLEVEVAL